MNVVNIKHEEISWAEARERLVDGLTPETLRAALDVFQPDDYDWFDGKKCLGGRYDAAVYARCVDGRFKDKQMLSMLSNTLHHEHDIPYNCGNAIKAALEVYYENMVKPRRVNT